MFPLIQGRSWAELFIDITVLKTFIGWAASVLCSLTRAEMIYCIIPRSLVTVVGGRPPTLTCPRRGDVRSLHLYSEPSRHHAPGPRFPAIMTMTEVVGPTMSTCILPHRTCKLPKQRCACADILRQHQRRKWERKQQHEQ